MIRVETNESITQEFLTTLEPIFSFLSEGSSVHQEINPTVYLYPYWKEEELQNCTALMSVYMTLNPVSVHIVSTFSEELKTVASFLQGIHPLDFVRELCIHPPKPQMEYTTSFNRWVKSNFLSKGVFHDITHKDFLRSTKYLSYHSIFAPLELITDYTHLMAARWECAHSSITIGFTPKKEWVLMPTHGSAKEMEGLGILNPTAWLMMLALSGYLSGNTEKATQLWRAIVENRAKNPENTTPEEGGILTTNNYIRNIVTFL